MLELNKFNLTTPEDDGNGNPLTLFPPFSDDNHIQLLANGNIRLWAPTIGATTQNSSRTRTEFRGIDETGLTQDLRNVVFGQEGITLRGGMTLEQVTPNGRVVVCQLHVKNSSRPLFKLVWDNGTIKAKMRQVFNQTDDVNTLLMENVSMTDRISWSVILRADRTFSLYFSCADGRSEEVHMPIMPSYDGQLVYGKLGLYNQEDATAEHTAMDGSACVLDKLEVIYG